MINLSKELRGLDRDIAWLKKTNGNIKKPHPSDDLEIMNQDESVMRMEALVIALERFADDVLPS